MKLGIVIPWFGRELKGGAEQQAWQIASRLAARGHTIEVLTTCCRSHQDDWATNHLPAGDRHEPEGFTIRRFPVAPRDRAEFDRVCGHLLSIDQCELRAGVPAVSAADSRIFTDELIKSPALLEFLRERKADYDWVLFLPYLYGPVIRGVEIVGERAALQPCLHDESYAYLPEVADAFHRCGKLLFNSDGEQELAAQLFGPGILTKSLVVGEGVETSGSAGDDSEQRDASRRYVLYLGRKDAGKNLPMLLSAFRRFRAVRPNTDLELVLAGNGSVELNGDSAGIEDVGLVDDAEKERLLRDCVALFQPSEKESFSRVIMEAWMHGRPVAAHGDCLATAVAVQRSGGGWTAGDEREWAALFTDVARLPERELVSLGERGRDYAETLADWDRVMERYEQALTIDETTTERLEINEPRAAINQFLPNFSYGDAISNYAIWIRNRLREFGFESEIYVRYIDPRVEHECRVFSPDALHASDGAIYHHSIGSEITPPLLEFTGPKCVIYHNITPAEFFEPFWPDYAPVLRRGRADLPAIAAQFDVVVGVSAYNTAELTEGGCEAASVLPIPVDPRKWDFAPDKAMMARLQDGRTNILFVGRIAPNKRQDDLASAFREYLAFDPTARLIIVGKAEPGDPYATHLDAAIANLGLRDHVLRPGSITDAELAACYRTADLYWSMSEHEGFCVPLIEAMWFDVPVLAFRSSAVPETLGEGGLMFTDKGNWSELAALAYVMITDADLRAKVIAAQRRQRETFLPARVVPVLAKLVDAMRTSRASAKATRAWPQVSRADRNGAAHDANEHSSLRQTDPHHVVAQP